MHAHQITCLPEFVIRRRLTSRRALRDTAISGVAYLLASFVTADIWLAVAPPPPFDSAARFGPSVWIVEYVLLGGAAACCCALGILGVWLAVGGRTAPLRRQLGVAAALGIAAAIALLWFSATSRFASSLPAMLAVANAAPLLLGLLIRRIAPLGDRAFRALSHIVEPLVWYRRFRVSYRLDARRDRHLCPHCRYDLRASGDRCPECGRPVVRSLRRLPGMSNT